MQAKPCYNPSCTEKAAGHWVHDVEFCSGQCADKLLGPVGHSSASIAAENEVGEGAQSMEPEGGMPPLKKRR